MASKPVQVFLQSSESAKSYQSGVNFFFSYHLEKVHLLGSEQNFVRVLYSVSDIEPYLIFADFAEKSEVNGSLEPLIACSSASSHPWVPITTPYIPTTGFLWARQFGLLPSGDYPSKIAIYLEFAPRSWLERTSWENPAQ